MWHNYFLNYPAKDWEHATPIGNGRLGASILGGVENERIIINEETIWYGAERKRKNPESVHYVEEIRRLLLDGQVEEAQFLCQMAMTSMPKYIAPYQPACDINLLFFQGHEPVSGYKRKLDMKEALSVVSYASGGTNYVREAFVSHRYQVVALRFTAKGERKLKFQFNLNRRPFEDKSGAIDGQVIFCSGQSGNGVQYFTGAVVGYHDGISRQIGDYLSVEAAGEAVIYLGCETDYENYFSAGTGSGNKNPRETCLERLRTAMVDGYEEVKRAHREDYGRLYGRMELEVAGQGYETLSVHEVIKRCTEEDARKYLTQLTFHFGRYLMICCSYDCLLPATLQGIWNGSYTPRWESKYTININLQMNYWMVDSCGLSECFEPYVRLLKMILANGRKTAEEIYGCHGSVAHHNVDCWGNSDIEGLPASAYMWPTGAAWLSLHLADHYRYTLDKEFLTQTVCPLLEESIRFFYDFLYRRSDGLWLCGPSVSPENTYRTRDGQEASITMAPAMDSQIIRELCLAYIEGYRELEERQDGEVYRMAEEICKHLPEISVSKDGRIMEWLEDYEEWEPGHRHMSHLFGLYPGSQITEDIPALWEGAKKSLEFRLANGGGHTGWSRAWIMCMYARLNEGEEMDRQLEAYFENSCYDNLYNAHPPFQIDGNFGFCAAVAEMLAHAALGGQIELLPSVPENWSAGKVRGLRLKGGYTLDMTWQAGRMVYKIHSLKQGRISVSWHGESCVMDVRKGQWEEGVIEA